MKLSYDHSPADSVAWRDYLWRHDPETRARVTQQRLSATALVGFALIGVVCVLSFSLEGQVDIQSALVMGLLGAVGEFFYYPTEMRRRFLKYLRRSEEHLQQEGILGPHELEIRSEGLIERTPVNETVIPWSGVHGVTTEGDWRYIQLGRCGAYVVCRQRVTEGNLDAFVAEVHRRTLEASAKP